MSTTTFEAYTHSGDEELLGSLGLLTRADGPGWHDLGTATIQEAEMVEGVRRPAATVQVEVMALPAQFWRFTITRPRDETEELGGGKWRPVYEPVERCVLETGSGAFSGYWPTAQLFAKNMLGYKDLP